MILNYDCAILLIIRSDCNTEVNGLRRKNYWVSHMFQYLRTTNVDARVMKLDLPCRMGNSPLKEDNVFVKVY